MGDMRTARGKADRRVVRVTHRNGGKLGVIRKAQENLAAELANAVTVRSDDTSECFHYDSGAQVVIGIRAAEAMVELLKAPGRK